MRVQYILGAALTAAAVAGCKPTAETPAPEPAIVEAKLDTAMPLNCKPATGIFDFLSQVGVYDVWDGRPIRPVTIATFEAEDGKPMPLKMIYRFDSVDTEMVVHEDGSLIFAYDALEPEGGELCLLDPARVGDDPGGLDLAINAEFVFNHNSDGYSAEILKEGSEISTEYIARVIKLNTGEDVVSVLGKADWISIGSPHMALDSWTMPEHKLIRGNEVVPYGTSDSGDYFFSFSLREALAAGAERLVISGEDYKLSAMFNPDTVPEDYKEILGVK